MFEDIDDNMKKGKGSAGGKDDVPAGRRKRFGGNFEDELGEEMAKFLEHRFGGHAKRVPGGIAYMPAGRHGSDDPHQEIYDKLKGTMKTLAYMAEQMKIPPTCLDANKIELAVGDVLKCPGGDFKTVLKLGWKFAILSHTDDQTKEDGAWFEEEINLLNFIKKT